MESILMADDKRVERTNVKHIQDITLEQLCTDYKYFRSSNLYGSLGMWIVFRDGVFKLTVFDGNDVDIYSGVYTIKGNDLRLSYTLCKDLEGVVEEIHKVVEVSMVDIKSGNYKMGGLIYNYEIDFNRELFPNTRHEYLHREPTWKPTVFYPEQVNDCE